MKKNQTLKLAKVLLDEAVTCALRNDIDDAKHLSTLAVQHEFGDEIKKIISGDSTTFIMVVRNQYAKNPKVSFVARVMLDYLLENEDFKKTFREKFINLHLEEWGF